MNLFSRNYGTQGQPLLILHGLFGQSDNWNTLAKQFSENGFRVFALDLRNHGLSPQSDEWDYPAMSHDVLEFCESNKLQNIILLGHSMGGKVAMQFALTYPQLLDKLIVADMAPRQYGQHQQAVLQALNAVDFSKVNTRKEVENILNTHIEDFGTRQFLLKNLYWKEENQLDWRFNLKVITQNIIEMGKATPDDVPCEIPTLFIRGEKSNYITKEDETQIHQIFTRVIIETIPNAGHWLHAEKPKEFFDCVLQFIK